MNTQFGATNVGSENSVGEPGARKGAPSRAIGSSMSEKNTKLTKPQARPVARLVPGRLTAGNRVGEPREHEPAQREVADEEHSPTTTGQARLLAWLKC